MSSFELAVIIYLAFGLIEVPFSLVNQCGKVLAGDNKEFEKLL